MPSPDINKRRAYGRQHYQDHRVDYLDKARKWQRQQALTNRHKVREYLRAHPCIDCGNRDPLVLDFDHVSGIKTASISVLSSTGRSWKLILKEIEKCEVRCANCHRRITHLRRVFSKILGDDVRRR